MTTNNILATVVAYGKNSRKYQGRLSQDKIWAEDRKGEVLGSIPLSTDHPDMTPSEIQVMFEGLLAEIDPKATIKSLFIDGQEYAVDQETPPSPKAPWAANVGTPSPDNSTWHWPAQHGRRREWGEWGETVKQLAMSDKEDPELPMDPFDLHRPRDEYLIGALRLHGSQLIRGEIFDKRELDASNSLLVSVIAAIGGPDLVEAAKTGGLLIVIDPVTYPPVGSGRVYLDSLSLVFLESSITWHLTTELGPVAEDDYVSRKKDMVLDFLMGWLQANSIKIPGEGFGTVY